MPELDTPPQSPAEYADEEDIPFDEGDVIEVVDDDVEPEVDESEDEMEEADGMEDEKSIQDQDEIVPERDDAKLVFTKHTGFLPLTAIIAIILCDYDVSYKCIAISRWCSMLCIPAK